MIPHADRLVCVEWEDAWADSAWHEVQEAHTAALKPVVAWSVGYVVQETTEAIVLSCSVVPEGLGGLTRIPNGMIRSVTHLQPGKAA